MVHVDGIHDRKGLGGLSDGHELVIRMTVDFVGKLVEKIEDA